jgi:hypothetical protein
MKLQMPTAQEIYNMAERAEQAIYHSDSRAADKLIIENAIRNALAIVVDRMDIQIPQPIGLDLSKLQ